MALPQRPADVTQRIGLAHPGERKGGGTVGVVAPLFPDHARVAVVDIGVVAEIDAADCFDERLDAAHRDLNVMIDFQTAQLFDCADEELGAANGVSGVELAAAVVRDLDVSVSRERNEGRLAGFGYVQKHDRVRTLAFGRVVDRALFTLVRTDD